MFDSLRKSFTRFSKTLAEKDLSESDIEEILEDLEMSLLQSDVALEVVEDISSDLKRQLVGVSVNKKQLESFVKGALSESVSQLFQKTGSLDLLERIREKNENDEPYTIVFLGINGTGKTTTLAKFAHMLKKNKFTVVIAAADTFRAGAIEQIRKHGERLQVKIIAQNYNSDPAAVCRDATLYAKSHRINCVLIDTAGRIQTSTNLMQQIEKITKVVNPDLKIFVGDSLAGNDAISQAREFHEYTEFDCSILTKSDADTKGGSALSIVKITSKPILYLGVGQEYPDLKEFRWESFVESVLGERDSMDGELAAKIQTVLETPLAVNTSTHDTAPEVVTSPESADVLESEAKGEIDEDIVKEESEEIQESEDVDIDPFEGIDDADIAAYSDIHDVPPPESDNTARVLAAEIKEWISQGRPISDGPSISEKSVKHERDVTDQSDDTA
ncbi:MAG: signal recognition particle-docking protein FtsY, partial [Cenarchaeum sp. SB0669_bin_11]|nr:signal recognition particle-docking protein FtsY [Cenarchaeum sp. SB0669_bin_11]